MIKKYPLLITLAILAIIGGLLVSNKNTTKLTSLNPTLTTSEAGFNDIVINARGTNGKEKIALFINNQPVEFWNLTRSFKDYTYTPNGEITVSELSIHFLNDTWEPENNINYDVQIPYITVNGTKYNSEHSSTVSTGSWDQEDWCAPGNKQTQWLNCNGSFTYNIPVGTVVGLPTTNPICGNNQIEEGETCDDGNIASGDGCSASCVDEVLDLTDGMVNLSDRLTSDTRGLRAFPGAEGGGQYSTGGRNGQLFIVDSLECTTVSGDGKRTLPEALQRLGDATGIGPIYITFDVGGMIACDEVHSMPLRDVNTASLNPAFWEVKSDTTLACQTAPDPGVHIAAWRIEYKAVNNIISRGCHVYGLDESGDSQSVLRVVGSGNSSDLIFDRMGYFHNVDDLTLAYIGYSSSGVDNGTISRVSMTNTIIAEPDAYSTHSEANPASSRSHSYMHAMGSGCSTAWTQASGGARDPVVNCSYIGNAIFEAERRTQKVWDASGHILGAFAYNTGTSGFSVLANTVSQNPDPKRDGKRSEHIDMHMVDNTMLYGPNSRMPLAIEGLGLRVTVPSNPNFYQVNVSNNQYVQLESSTPIAYPERVGSPVAERAMTLDDARFHPTRDWLGGLADKSAFECVGPPSKWRTADMDRIIDDAIARTGEIGIGGVYGANDQPDGDHGRFYLTEDGSKIGGVDANGNPAVYNNYFPETSHPAAYDTDDDGMQDVWELANGLNVGIQDHNDDLDGDGYTNIEEYMNALMRCN